MGRRNREALGCPVAPPPGRTAKDPEVVMSGAERPKPSSAAASARLAKQKPRDTKVELSLRSALHRRGMRFRIHRRPLPKLRREADIVFTRSRVAIFVDGCFWHGCPQHGSWPRANAEWWRAKIENNRARDRDTDTRLTAEGWISLRVWSHETPEEAANRIATVVAERRRPTS
jgi:DNA mismatch endonuclease (patch repair protein)